MGLEIKRNKKGLYQMKSSISDEIIHEGNWINENDAKLTLIEKSYWKFIEETVKIYMEFPNTYYINSIPPKTGGIFSKWWLERNCRYKDLYEEYLRIKEEIGLNLDIE